MSRTVVRDQPKWDELVPHNIERWSGLRFTADSRSIATFRSGPVTIIVVKTHGSDGDLRVTKMRGGRELASRTTLGLPPRRLARAIKKARTIK